MSKVLQERLIGARDTLEGSAGGWPALLLFCPEAALVRAHIIIKPKQAASAPLAAQLFLCHYRKPGQAVRLANGSNVHLLDAFIVRTSTLQQPATTPLRVSSNRSASDCFSLRALADQTNVCLAPKIKKHIFLQPSQQDSFGQDVSLHAFVEMLKDKVKKKVSFGWDPIKSLQADIPTLLSNVMGWHDLQERNIVTVGQLCEWAPLWTPGG